MAMEEPLQLITFASPSDAVDEVGGIQLNHSNLDRVLARTENRPLCVICVGGPSRQGKSFLLGYMIRCLEALEKDETDWMDWEHKDKPLSGFKFRNGTKPETQGIWLWSKPFLINVGSEETPIAVLLVDTQGTYDEFISSRTTASIVGISLLMSSCMVFNFFKNLQEDVLTSLESYIKYGQLALQGQDPSDESKPFQKLTFLIRDWNNPAEFAYGAKGGKGFLDKKLEIKDNQSLEAKSLRQTIKSCFETLDCYLMPYPGDPAIMPEFQGSIQELNTQFAKKLEDFISNLINPDDLGDTSIKTVFGNHVTASEFRSLLETYIDAFNSREIPTPISLLQATAQVTNQGVLQKSLKKHLEALSNQQRKKKYLKEEDLAKGDKLGRNQALTVFKNARKFGNKESLQDLEDQLEGMLERQWKEVKKANQEKRNKFIAGEMESAMTTFKKDLQMEFPFAPDNSLDYYDEVKIAKKAKAIVADILDEFQEKIGDDQEDDESLEKLRAEVENKLKEWLSNNVILENQSRQKLAEKGLQKLTETVCQEYAEKLGDFLQQNPFLDLNSNEATAFQEPHDEMKTELKSRFAKEKGKFAAKGSREPAISGYTESDVEAKLVTIFNDLSNQHMVQLQQRQLTAQRVIDELVELWKNDMESAFLTDLEDLESWTDNKKPEFQKMFENQYGLPRDCGVFKENLDLLFRKLNNVFNEAAFELEQKAKAAQQTLENAIKDGLASYQNEMAKQVKENPFMGGEEFCKLNDQCVRNAEKIYKNSPVPSVNLQNEGLETLKKRLAEDFEHLAEKVNQHQELARNEAKILVTDCHAAYENEMKTCMEQVKSQDKLKEGHAQANENSQKMFIENCPIKDASFTKLYIDDLDEQNQEAFEDILELFELKMGEEEVTTEAAKAECRMMYDDEMGKYFKNQDFLRPDELTKLHEAVAKKCVDDQNQKTPLTQSQRTELKASLEEGLKKWMEQNDMNLEGDDVAIGIDLGTTYSCVAVYAGGKIRVIPNAQGKNTTPSYVAYNADGSEMVGEPAKSRAYENPENTIFDAKRIIGRKMTDPKLQRDITYWAFTVEDDAGIPKILVRGKKLHPEQISAQVLKELKECAEKYLKRDVKKAVITVPAYFTDGQRQATKDAGELAGLEVMQVLTEPVAAAMAYKKQHADTFGVSGGMHRNTLIFDLGGGTFDVAVLKSKQGELETLAIDGDDHLGGEDFDRALMEYCAEEFRKREGINLLDGRDSTQKQTRDEARRRLKRLQGECERKKIELTSARRVEVLVDSIHGRTDLKVGVTRDKFEELNDSLFRKTLEAVENALKGAKLDKSQIHDIVLVGGSTRIPRIQELLSGYFGGKALDVSINPDEAVAYGAAMKAAIMNGAITRENTDFTKIQDVTPMSIGVEVYGGGFSVIIPKNTKIPVKAQERYKTAHNNQTSVQVTIYQGEETIAVHNRHLGDFYLNGIPPNDAEVENIDVEMTINAQGILHVNAVCSSTGGNTGIRVTENKQRMSRAAIQRLLDEACAA